MLFSILALSLLLTLGFILFTEMNPEWKRYQKAYFRSERKKVAEALTHAKDSERRDLQKRLNYLRRPRYEIRQILLDGGRHADRCTTCHLDLKQLESKHSETANFPFDEYGCTVCHGGVGRATSKARAHSTLRIPRRPLFEYLEAHRTGESTLDLFRYRADGKRIDFTGSELCLRCHLSSHPRHVARWRKLKFRPLKKVTDKLKALQKKGLTLKASKCFPCHTTAFDQRTGRYLEERVTCESCHGPGGFYAALMTGGRARDGAELARSNILKTRAEQVCLNCHKPDRHADYEGTDVPAILTAAYLNGNRAPKTDGNLSDYVWNTAPETKLSTWKLVGGVYAPGAVVFIRAVYSDTDIYLSFRWRDETYQERMGSWFFVNGKWQARLSWPDALALHWQITAAVKDFSQGGCAVLCHNTGRFKAFPRMATRQEGALVDEWVWNAFTAARTGRPGDGFLDNRIKFIPPESRKPALRWAHPAASAAHGSDTSGRRVPDALAGVPLILNAEEAEGKPPLPQFYLKGGKRTPLNPSDRRELNPKKMPLFELGPPEKGDSADIRGAAAWSDGFWTLELSRPLRTSSRRDVQFDRPSKQYAFGLAVWDGAAGDQHQVAPIARLQFGPSAEKK